MANFTSMGLSYDDVLLRPKRAIVFSRENVNLGTRLTTKLSIDIPIVSAPMNSVTNGEMAKAMAKAGGFGIIHRFQSIEAQADEFAEAIDLRDSAPNDLTDTSVGLALGVNERYERMEHLKALGARVFCIDVAHAHGIVVDEFVRRMPLELRADTHLIVGNVGTREGFIFLASLGVDAIKVGIGPGAACQTREVTGFGVPQLSAIIETAQARATVALKTGKYIPIIADGGIKSSGDIVKALAAGADTVMLGKLLAGADEAPLRGEYFGMASRRVNGHLAPEGAEGSVPDSGPVSKIVRGLAWGIRSGVSYGGGKTLYELRENAEFIPVAAGVFKESSVRL